jgi:hypothetical protein
VYNKNVMNSTRKNGLITFGLIVVGLNVLLLLFFALKYNDIKSPLSDTILNPVSFTDPISFP